MQGAKPSTAALILHCCYQQQSCPTVIFSIFPFPDAEGARFCMTARVSLEGLSTSITHPAHLEIFFYISLNRKIHLLSFSCEDALCCWCK